MATGPQNEKLDKCFIITPIGDSQSNIRRSTDGISKAIIEPLLKEFNMEPVAAHEISELGSINDKVIEHIYNDKLAIVNLTGLNSNVMYELGVRYTMRKHTILICEEGTKLPFDIVAERTIFYKNDIAGSLDLVDGLRKTLNSINFEDEPDNPIFKVLDFQNAMGKIKKEDVTDALVERLKELIDNKDKPIKQEKSVYCTVLKNNGKPFLEKEADKIRVAAYDLRKNGINVSISIFKSNLNIFNIKFILSNNNYEDSTELIP